MKTNHIKQVAVLGSGVMGSQIACHFANIGLQVLLLDIVPNELTAKEKEAGKTLEDSSVRNRIVNDSLQAAIKLKPAPLYNRSFVSRITTGNFTDDFEQIKHADWIIEVVVERLDIKKTIFDQVEQYRKPGSLVSSNTSGIPIAQMSAGRSQEFQEHFCGTHFFNPPRYLQLFEVIPGPQTKQEVIDFFMHYGDLFLGKTSVLAKDTPAFIANRIGVFSMMAILQAMKKHHLTIEEVESLTGKLTGRPKSATFRTADVVGIDTFAKVAKGIQQNAKEDQFLSIFSLPSYLEDMIDKGWLGQKAGQGFFKKVTDRQGDSQILTLDIESMEYRERQKASISSVSVAKSIDNVKDRLIALNKANDKGANFLREVHCLLFQYVSYRIPDVADYIYQIDDAVKAGFGWELGPFEIWDTLGVKRMVEVMKEAKMDLPDWVHQFVKQNHESFYKKINQIQQVYDVATNEYIPLNKTESILILDHIREQKPVWQNSGTTLHDIGDGVLCLEFQTKMNAMGSEVIQGINESIQIAESQGWKGLVIGNHGENFSAGANLAMILMTAIEQEFDELNFMIKMFQDTMMRVRYSSIPVVTAPHGLALGGGCEISLHADKVRAAAETYTGLVEFGVGLLPAGGGTKEMAKRVSESLTDGDVIINRLQKAFVNIATAEVATSAYEAMNMHYIRAAIDEVTVNKKRLLHDAKQDVIQLYNSGYTCPLPAMVEVQGRSALGSLLVGTNSFYLGNYASEHDKLIAEKIAYVLCGGDLSMPQKVSEQYLLDLEREAFLSLLGTPKTLERIQHMLQTGKPLRN